VEIKENGTNNLHRKICLTCKYHFQKTAPFGQMGVYRTYHYCSRFGIALKTLRGCEEWKGQI